MLLSLSFFFSVSFGKSGLIEFVSTISNGTIELSEEELSQMFWDALYEFPETELSTQDILRYGCEVNLNPKILTEKEIEEYSSPFYYL